MSKVDREGRVMNILNIAGKNQRALAAGLLILLVNLTNGFVVFAHGGEDHGDAKPKSTANAKGIVTHSSRLGEIEIMVKHPDLEPDKATEGRLFLTSFATNAPFSGANATVEIESENGNVYTVAIESSEQAGSYALKIPAMPLGVYKMLASVSHGGETDATTFSGLQVKVPVLVVEGETSWLTQTAIFLVFGLVIVLLGGLIYVVWRFAGGPSVNEDPISV